MAQGSSSARGAGADKFTAKDLVQRANKILKQREAELDHEEGAHESKRELVSALLQSAFEVATEDETEESMEELRLAIDGAQKLNTLPELRNRCRRKLEVWDQRNRKKDRVQSELQKLSRKLKDVSDKLESLSESDALGQTSTSSASSQGASATQHANLRLQQDLCLKHLDQALNQAGIEDCSPDVVKEVRENFQGVLERRKAEKNVAKKLEGLLNVNDAEKLQEVLLNQKESLTTGLEARRMLSAVAGRVMRLAEQEQLQSWLLQELAAAGEAMDAARLQQLVIQAHSLRLTVPPEILALLDSLKADPHHQVLSSTMLSSTMFSSTASSGSSKLDTKQRADAFLSRRRAMLREAMEMAEADPSKKTLDAARKAVAEAKQTITSDADVADMERRLKKLEHSDEPRLEVEIRLQKLLSLSEMISIDGIVDDLLVSEEKTKELGSLLESGKRLQANKDLMQEAEGLYEKSIEIQQLRRTAHDELRKALTTRGQSEVELERLQEALAECRRLSMNVHKAEREMHRLREEQVSREAAQAELVEASKGAGAAGRQRLETAVRAAKGAGVSAEKLRAASQRLSELAEHEQRCAVMAGEVKRALPMLEKEPWRYQQLVEAAESLKPWTQQLDRLFKIGEDKLMKINEDNSRVRDAQSSLSSQIKKIEERRAAGEPIYELLSPLENLLEKAKSSGVREEVIRQGQQHLRNAKRDGCQRSVAEHKLRLALNARDRLEIERSMRQVRALGLLGVPDQSAAKGVSSAPNSARQEQTNSTRLMDMASSMLRNLGEASVRRQAAATSLQQHISSIGPGSAQQVTPTTTGDASASEGTTVWLKQAQDALQEAKQSGVSGTLIEQAKLVIRSKRRARQNQEDACKELQQVLSKKDVPPQVLKSKMCRVQRSQKMEPLF